jgi:LPXTG-motif cell wall-anchored protein
LYSGIYVEFDDDGVETSVREEFNLPYILDAGMVKAWMTSDDGEVEEIDLSETGFTATDAEGVYGFSLMHNWFITIDGLPVGTTFVRPESGYETADEYDETLVNGVAGLQVRGSILGQNAEKAQNVIAFENIYKESKGKISVTKVWPDGYGRNDKIDVYLTINGEVQKDDERYHGVIRLIDGVWQTIEFDNLPLGYEYGVIEDAVPSGYMVAYSESIALVYANKDAINVITIANTRISVTPPEEPVPPPDNPVPTDDDDGDDDDDDGDEDGEANEFGDPPIDITDSGVPQGVIPRDDEYVFFEEDVPLGNLPQTGTEASGAGAAGGLGFLSAGLAGLAAMFSKKKKED